MMHDKTRTSLDRASVRIVLDDDDNEFITVDGVQIAKRGRIGTPQAGTWISLEPGWSVLDGPSYTKQGSIKHGSIVVEYRGTRVH
jgi:hypothetical protein